MKDLHSLGYLHLDIKPDNIIISTNNYEEKESGFLNLIDFGISRKYLNDDNTHIPKTSNMKFMGNIVFASKNAFSNYGMFQH